MSWKKRAFACREMEDKELIPPERFKEVFQDSALADDHEAFYLLLHVLIIEEHFIPCAPKSHWKKSHFYTIGYTHPTTDDLVCHLKYLPCGNQAIIFGTAVNKEVSKLTINLPDFRSRNQEQRDPFKMFRNLSHLSKIFKDRIVLKMLAGLQDHVNMNPTFGLPALATEVKLMILQKLTAKGLVAMSAVNQEFRELVEQPSMWQFMLLRDFPVVGKDADSDWKDHFKKEYEQKRKAEEAAEKERAKTSSSFFDNHRFALMLRHNHFRPTSGFPPELNSRMPQPGSSGLPQSLFGMPKPPTRKPDLAFYNNFF